MFFILILKQQSYLGEQCYKAIYILVLEFFIHQVGIKPTSVVADYYPFITSIIIPTPLQVI